ncbi:hypothetical protein Strain138_001770 [Pseudogemmatithrix spongiicola]|uniref:Polysaccharide chain length determinant N-terminal domain-containing protein n=1 Tax=Pseudogemmatithrix spongiicola TaxID=3062599 RepID=A0AA49K0D8_9BACT|nr:hypothetical protein Strain138_001770 [Gemmatimonadaceae bacterium 'strain 138']WKW15384.1 hypothetical protein Strain318_001769 [Gemmatimonadaceae bacterium 'strain 318']
MLPPDDVVDPRALLAAAQKVIRRILDARWRLLGGLLAGATLGVILSFAFAPAFRSESRLLPYRGGSPAGGLSGLAGLAGIRVDPGMFEPTVTADLFPEIVRSMDFQVALASAPIRVGSLGRSMPVGEYLRYLADSTWRGKLSTYTLGLPGLLLGGGDDGATAVVPDSSAARGPATPSWAFMKRILEQRRRVSVAYDKKTSLVTITTELPDAVAAADLAQLVSDRLMAAIVGIETRKADEQLRFASAQREVVSARYEAAQRALAAFADRNRTLMSATAAVERLRLEREAEMAYEMFSEMSRQYEQLKVKKSQDTPAFSVLQQPVVAPRKSSPRRSLFAVAGAVFGLAAVSGTLAIGRLRGDVPA